MGYKFSKYSKTIINVDKVVLVNRYTGQWIRISKEVYDILNLGIENNYSIEQLKSSLYDEEDREYIDDLYKKLCFIGVIEDKNSVEPVMNKNVTFQITNKCNLKCVHCCVEAGEESIDEKDLTTIEIKEALDKLIKWRPRSITLTGGEPMIRNDFKDIIVYLRKNYDGKIIILTNGTLINEENINIIINNVNQIDISIDGIDEETCSIVRGEGVFDKVINSVKALKHRGFKNISLSMVFGDKNDHLKDIFIELNNSLQTKPVIRGFEPVGRGANNEFVFSDKKSGESKLTKSFLNEKFYKTFTACNCSAAIRKFYINYNGDIYPCQSFINEEYKLDNIKAIKNLDDIQTYKEKNKKVYKKLEMFNPEKFINCKDCKVNLFCLPCPAELELLQKDKECFNDTCKKIKPILYKQIWGEIL